MTSDSGILCPADPKTGRQRRLKIRRGKNQVAHDQDAEVVDQQKPKPEEREKPTELALLFSRSSSSKNDTLLEEKESLQERVRSFSPLSYGVVSVIGRRREMEDAVRAELGFMNLQSEPLDFFAVYDGHGGPQVAEGCWERLHKVLEEVIKEGEGEDGGGFKNGGVVDWEKVMVGCFGRMDGEFIGEDVAEDVKTVGTTAVVAVVGKEVVVVANCGDSRAVLSKGGVALALSVDHKPERPDELSRVEAAGGKVISWDGLRIMGVLATSRSIGDMYLKPYVISEPEVVVSNRTDDDEFLILASDGLWDVVSNDFACKVVRKCLGGRMRRKSQDRVHLENFASEAAAVLAELAMARGSRDNISVIVVELNKSRKLQL